MGNYFKHDEVFPIIAGAIEDHCRKSSSYMAHEDIVAALLGDPEGSRLVDWARERAKFERDRKSRDWTREQWADNMVAWFSQKIAVAQSIWRHRFERQRIDRKWAYKMCGTPTSTANVHRPVGQ